MGSVMKLKVTLDFACSGCAKVLLVEVECSGSGLWAEGSPRAAVHLACPTCGAVNRVEFEPNGSVHEVTAACSWRMKLEPSIN
jgi:hypothetical protein